MIRPIIRQTKQFAVKVWQVNSLQWGGLTGDIEDQQDLVDYVASHGGGGGGGGHTIQDEGSPLTQRTNLNFVGAGVTVTDGGAGLNSTIVTIPSTDTSGLVPTSRTVNGYALSSNVTISKSDVGLGSVPNTDATNPANITQSASYRFATDTEKGTWNTASTNAAKYIIPLNLSDNISPISVGSKTKYQFLYANTLSDLVGTLGTAATGATVTIDIKRTASNTSIFNTKLTIDATEKTSRTAATPYVLTANPTTFAADEEIEILYDTVGSVEAGRIGLLSIITTI